MIKMSDKDQERIVDSPRRSIMSKGWLLLPVIGIALFLSGPIDYFARSLFRSLDSAPFVKSIEARVDSILTHNPLIGKGVHSILQNVIW